jgi:purine-binding chemotaxis protein CheW
VFDRRNLYQMECAMNSPQPKESMENTLYKLVVFTLSEQRYALCLGAVERVFPFAEVTHLPQAPEVVLGVVNVRGRIIPVVDIRKRLRLPDRETNLSDRLIVAQTSRRTVALIADAVSGVVEGSKDELIAAETILPGLEYVEGVTKLEDGMILIHNLEKFLSLEEEKTLDQALKQP